MTMAEILGRMALQPANHLNLPQVPHDTLGTYIPGGTLGFDEWGFRNASVPEKADIVTIGDSHTIGTNASLGDSWPGQLEKMSGKEVYNLSGLGYGPVQYYHLFKTRGLKLKPDRVIVGFFVGNDLLDSYQMTSQNKYWENLRNSRKPALTDSAGKDPLDQYLADHSSNPKWDLFSRLDSWLAGQSILYRLGFHNDYIQELQKAAPQKNFHRASYPALTVPGKRIKERFQSVRDSYKMNVHNKKIQDGLKVSLRLFKKMQRQSKEKGIKFSVLLIPTKEMVYSHYLFNNDKIKNSEQVDKLLNSERLIREISMRFFRENNINYIDALPSMQQAVDSESLFAPMDKQYPNSRGYHYIAKSFYKYHELNQIANK